MKTVKERAIECCKAKGLFTMSDEEKEKKCNKTFDELYKLGEEFRKSLGLTDEEIIESLKTSDKDLLKQLKESGKRLKENLNISPEDIEKALKEARQEWKD